VDPKPPLAPVTYWGRSAAPPPRRRTSPGSLAAQVAAGVLAVLAGIWAALSQPALGLFEQTMRTLGIVGGILSALWLLHTVLVVFITMLAVVFVVSLAVGTVGRE